MARKKQGQQQPQKQSIGAVVGEITQGAKCFLIKVAVETTQPYQEYTLHAADFSEVCVSNTPCTFDCDEGELKTGSDAKQVVTLSIPADQECKTHSFYLKTGTLPLTKFEVELKDWEYDKAVAKKIKMRKNWEKYKGEIVHFCSLRTAMALLIYVIVSAWGEGANYIALIIIGGFLLSRLQWSDPLKTPFRLFSALIYITLLGLVIRYYPDITPGATKWAILFFIPATWIFFTLERLLAGIKPVSGKERYNPYPKWPLTAGVVVLATLALMGSNYLVEMAQTFVPLSTEVNLENYAGAFESTDEYKVDLGKFQEKGWLGRTWDTITGISIIDTGIAIVTTPFIWLFKFFGWLLWKLPMWLLGNLFYVVGIFNAEQAASLTDLPWLGVGNLKSFTTTFLTTLMFIAIISISNIGQELRERHEAKEEKKEGKQKVVQEERVSPVQEVAAYSEIIFRIRDMLHSWRKK